jgi:hypothetical protein
MKRRVLFKIVKAVSSFLIQCFPGLVVPIFPLTPDRQVFSTARVSKQL